MRLIKNVLCIMNWTLLILVVLLQAMWIRVVWGPGQRRLKKGL